VATDGASNTNTCSFTVTINDTEAPVITCPTNLVRTTTPGQCVASNVTFTVTASDNCPGVTVVSTPPSGSTFLKGTNIVTSVVTDAAGNTNRCTFAVIVIDVEPPTIACSTNVIVAAPAGQSSVVANFPVPIFSDNCPGASGACSPPSGSTFAVGTTTVTCTAGDSSSNTSACTFTVAVTSTAANSAPVALCRNVTNSVGTNCLGALTVAAVDNGSFDPDGTIVSRTLNPPGPFQPGTLVVTLTVIDNQGASNSCSATVDDFGFSAAGHRLSGEHRDECSSGTDRRQCDFCDAVSDRQLRHADSGVRARVRFGLRNRHFDGDLLGDGRWEQYEQLRLHGDGDFARDKFSTGGGVPQFDHEPR
jgi:hypothetical protein